MRSITCMTGANCLQTANLWWAISVDVFYFLFFYFYCIKGFCIFGLVSFLCFVLVSFSFLFLFSK